MTNQNPHPKQPVSVELIETYVWAFVVVAITLILAGIVFSLLYSVTFVTQPIKSMAPIDQAYTKMLNDIVLLIVGGIGGVVGKKGVGMAVNAISGGAPAAPPPATLASGVVIPTVPQPAPVAPSGLPNFNWMGYQNPELDETWTPGPPPTTPPEHLEPEEDRATLAAARREVSAP